MSLDTDIVLTDLAGWIRCALEEDMPPEEVRSYLLNLIDYELEQLAVAMGFAQRVDGSWALVRPNSQTPARSIAAYVLRHRGDRAAR